MNGFKMSKPCSSSHRTAIVQVADQTILALARHSNACLECLDLSFCRLVDDECLGLLADACLQLQELKLYGCTQVRLLARACFMYLYVIWFSVYHRLHNRLQVTDKFLNGHSNLKLKVVGLRNSVWGIGTANSSALKLIVPATWFVIIVAQDLNAKISCL